MITVGCLCITNECPVFLVVSKSKSTSLLAFNREQQKFEFIVGANKKVLVYIHGVEKQEINLSFSKQKKRKRSVVCLYLV